MIEIIYGYTGTRANIIIHFILKKAISSGICMILEIPAYPSIIIACPIVEITLIWNSGAVLRFRLLKQIQLPGLKFVPAACYLHQNT